MIWNHVVSPTDSRTTVMKRFPLSLIACCCFMAAPFLSSCADFDIVGLTEAIIEGTGEVTTGETSSEDTSYDTTTYDTTTYSTTDYGTSAAYATQGVNSSPRYPRNFYRGTPPPPRRTDARLHDRRGPKPGARPQDRRGPKPGARPQDRRGPKPGARPQDRRGPKPGAKSSPGKKPRPSAPKA